MKTKDWSEMGKNAKKRYLYDLQGLYACNIHIDEVPFKDSAKPKVKRKRQYLERGMQFKLVAWLRSQDLLFTKITNEGKKSIITGQLDKALGITAGVSDLFLAEPRKGLAGYWIELKAPGKKPTDSQYVWLEKARQRGYKADWFDDLEKAKEAIWKYLYQNELSL